MRPSRAKNADGCEINMKSGMTAQPQLQSQFIVNIGARGLVLSPICPSGILHFLRKLRSNH
jgi:hypothetical protein